MKNLADIQAQTPAIALPIERVGVKGLYFSLRLRDRSCGIQTVSAEAAMSVDLPCTKRGTHMSRFVETLSEWHEELSYRSILDLLTSLRNRLESARAWVSFKFPYLLARQAPASAGMAQMAYNCTVSAELADTLSFTLEIHVPVMTVCPCSLAISDTGAHSQRAIAHIKLLTERFIWLEDLIMLAESCASSPVYPLLKREDEKFVTETAFARPAFVEDVARRIAAKLENLPQAKAFEVEIESMESIHNHNAFAFISSSRKI